MANLPPPFIRLTPKKIDAKAYQNNFNELSLVILTDNGEKLPGQTKPSYETAKYTVMANNGKGEHDPEYREHLWQHHDARISNEFRSLRIILIEREILEGLIQETIDNPLQSKPTPDVIPYLNDLDQYGCWSVRITLVELSLMCKRHLANGLTQILVLKDIGGDDCNMQVYLELKLTHGVEQLEKLQRDYWPNENNPVNDLLSPQSKGRRGRGAIREKEKVIVRRKNHVFQEYYFKHFTKCYICKEIVWGIAKEKCLKCNFCNTAVHEKCVNKVYSQCEGHPEIYQDTSGLQLNNAHNLKDKRLFSAMVKFDAQTAEPIYWSQKCRKCLECKNYYCMNTAVMNNCGSKELEIYAQLKEINKAQAEKGIDLNEAQVDIYGHIAPITVDKNTERNACLDALGDADANLHKKIGITANDRNLIKQRKSIKHAKKSYSYDDFTIITALGEGSFGKVVLASLARSNQRKPLAIKCVQKDVTVENYDVEAALLEEEVLMLGQDQRRGWKTITQAVMTFHDQNYLYYAMEFCPGGDLMGYVIRNQAVNPKILKIFAAEILMGLEFMHSNLLIFRDLKLDNVLINSEGHCTLADFGMVKKLRYESDRARTYCGTPDYMAPEILRRESYSFPVDIWAFAVVVFEMSEAFSPFSGNEEQLFNAIKYSEPAFRKTRKMSGILKDMLKNCFIKEQNERVGIDWIKRHQYFEGVNFEDVMDRVNKPGDKIPSDKYSKHFDPDNLNAPKRLDDPERTIGKEENKVFDSFGKTHMALIGQYN